MKELAYLIAWGLAVFGAANGTVVSHLTKPIRDFAIKLHPKLGALIQCTMCLGFWFGLIFSFLIESPTGLWLTDAFLGSAISWLIYILIYNKQFNLGGQGKCSSCQGEKTETQILTEEVNS